MITAASFKIRFPEFTSVSDARIELFIDDSVLILNETNWGEKYDLGLYYLTAHYLTLGEKSSAGNSGSNSQIASKAVDGTSVSYNNPTLTGSDDSYFSSTSYGQRYLELRKSLGAPAYVI